MGNIKRCPHCNGDAVLQSNYSSRYRAYFIFCKCTICGAQGKTCSSNTDPVDSNWEMQPCYDALAAWNMRYKPAATE